MFHEQGSAGGGAMQLTISGTLTLNGTICADASSDIPSYAGCGSGGSILLNVATLEGAGVITANGGSGPTNCNGGAGGGGRIAIYYTNAPTFNFAGQVFALGGGPGNCPNTLCGGAGTVYYQNAAQIGDLLVANGGRLGASTPVTIPQCGVLTVSSNAVLELSPGVTLFSLHLGPNGILTAHTTVFATEGSGHSPLTIGVLGDATLDPGSALTVDGKGFPQWSDLGPGAPPLSADYGAGASYGGLGGAGWSSAPVGTAYGSLTMAMDFGSAGGASDNGDAGTAGGGAINLVITGTLTVNGTISANGASDNSTLGGCGSGGSILISANTLRGSGTISANGGTGPADCDGGGGGGGRIALYYTTTDFNFGTQVFARGGGPFTCPNRLWGGAGTIFYKSNTQSVGNLVIDNGGNVGAQTPVTSPVASDLTISGGAVATASHGLTMNTLYLGTNSTLTDLPGDPSLDVLVWNSARLDAGSAISADATGYPVGANLGPGAPPDTSDYGGGGGYGGPGGPGYGGALGGTTYGFLTQPVDLGSACCRRTRHPRWRRDSAHRRGPAGSQRHDFGQRRLGPAIEWRLRVRRQHLVDGRLACRGRQRLRRRRHRTLELRWRQRGRRAHCNILFRSLRLRCHHPGFGSARWTFQLPRASGRHGHRLYGGHEHFARARGALLVTEWGFAETLGRLHRPGL
jgi:hypothetical protein